MSSRLYYSRLLHPAHPPLLTLQEISSTTDAVSRSSTGIRTKRETLFCLTSVLQTATVPAFRIHSSNLLRTTIIMNVKLGCHTLLSSCLGTRKRTQFILSTGDMGSRRRVGVKPMTPIRRTYFWTVHSPAKRLWASSVSMTFPHGAQDKSEQHGWLDCHGRRMDMAVSGI